MKAKCYEYLQQLLVITSLNEISHLYYSILTFYYYNGPKSRKKFRGLDFICCYINSDCVTRLKYNLNSRLETNYFLC